MDNQQTQQEQKPKKKSKKWLWILGGFILLIIVIASISSGNKTNSNQTQTTINQNIAETTTKTITIPSLVEYDDDKTADDTVQDIKQKNVAIPSNYTVVSASNPNITNPVGSEAIVSEVIDGDTVKLSDDNKVRILGIDTPETVDPRKAVQCFGKEASNKMKELVDGKKVILLVDASQGDKDKYGRLLRYIFISNTDIGAEMIKEGYAFAYTKYPVSKMEEYKSLEKQAREGKKGLWAENTCNGSTAFPTQATTQTNTNTATNANTNTSVNTNENTNITTNINTVANTNTATNTNTNTSTNLNVAPTPTNTNTDCNCSSNIYNCSDFKTYAEAQAIYDCCMAKVGKDIHDLDRDNDGLACESLK